VTSHAFALAALVVLGTAPVQCASKPGPERQLEDSPGQALYDLAEQFHASGNEAARLDTLRYLAQKYPKSRYAERARQDLGGSPAPSASAH
jgi:hypothetical protein